MKNLNTFFDNSVTTFVVTGDIHINTSKFIKFEKNRIKHLVKSINNKNPDMVILNGDIFDKAHPTLTDIDVFYQDLIEGLTCDNIILIAGNHEDLTKTTTCFDYLPQKGFVYADIGKLSLSNYDLYFVSHHKIDEILNIKLTEGKQNILFSHYRSKLGEFIDEEVDNSKISTKFDFVFLSDIHQRLEPYSNIIYTSSPHNLKFSTTLQKYGYLYLDLSKPKYDYVTLRDYNKYKIIVGKNHTDFTSAYSFIKKHSNWLFIVIFEDILTKDKHNIELTGLSNVVGVELNGSTSVDIQTKEAFKETMKEIETLQCLNMLDLITNHIIIDEIPDEVVKECKNKVRIGLNNA